MVAVAVSVTTGHGLLVSLFSISLLLASTSHALDITVVYPQAGQDVHGLFAGEAVFFFVRDGHAPGVDGHGPGPGQISISVDDEVVSVQRRGASQNSGDGWHGVAPLPALRPGLRRISLSTVDGVDSEEPHEFTVWSRFGVPDVRPAWMFRNGVDAAVADSVLDEHTQHVRSDGNVTVIYTCTQCEKRWGGWVQAALSSTPHHIVYDPLLATTATNALIVTDVYSTDDDDGKADAASVRLAAFILRQRAHGNRLGVLHLHTQPLTDTSPRRKGSLAWYTWCDYIIRQRADTTLPTNLNTLVTIPMGYPGPKLRLPMSMNAENNALDCQTDAETSSAPACRVGTEHRPFVFAVPDETHNFGGGGDAAIASSEWSNADTVRVLSRGVKFGTALLESDYALVPCIGEGAACESPLFYAALASGCIPVIAAADWASMMGPVDAVSAVSTSRIPVAPSWTNAHLWRAVIGNADDVIVSEATLRAHAASTRPVVEAWWARVITGVAERVLFLALEQSVRPVVPSGAHALPGDPALARACKTDCDCIGADACNAQGHCVAGLGNARCLNDDIGPGFDLNDVFDNVWVLNLRASLHRYELGVKRQLRKYGFDSKIWQARDGKNFTSSEFQSLLSPSDEGGPVLMPVFDTLVGDGTRSVAAVALSHISIMRNAVNRGSKWTLVLEDDALLAPHFSAALSKHWSSLPDYNDIDAVFLGTGSNNRLPLRIMNDYVFRPAQTVGMHGYAFTLHGAKRLLHSMLPFHMAIDSQIHNELVGTLNIFSFPPPTEEFGGPLGEPEFYPRGSYYHGLVSVDKRFPTQIPKDFKTPLASPTVIVSSPLHGSTLNDSSVLITVIAHNVHIPQECKINVFLDGRAIAQLEGSYVTLVMNDALPGEHTVDAALVDGDGNEVGVDVSSTFIVPEPDQHGQGSTWHALPWSES